MNQGCDESIYTCRVCGTPLVVGTNITQKQIDIYRYICPDCDRAYQRDQHREWSHRTGRKQPMNKNRQCPSFLGVHVSEQVLLHVFKHVERMPMNNPGYDFICGGGYKIDVKSACRTHHHQKNHSDNWIFIIKKNQIAEHFLMLAFDNRDDLNPEHIWLIPAGDINDRVGVCISESTLGKWDEYKLDVGEVATCCDIMKER